jgi:hypothetical protein
MKLRNKKTGEIIIPSDYTFATYDDGIKYGHHIYCSLAELNEDWEDYKPAEPLIKDEKVRKAVRAWAKANDFLDEIEVHTLTAGTRFSLGHYDIEFLGYFIYDLETNKTYTIAELCGEED